jgi:preprotein translocase subunit SecA
MLDQRIPLKPLPRGADAAWDIGAGLAGRFVPRYKKIISRVEKVLALEEDFSRMTDASLKDTAAEVRVLFRCRRDRPADLERAFALVREVAVRQIGEKPFPVQVAGAFALKAGCIAEMATGEGKTLACTMPAAVFGWRGLGCHVVTVNDYLAKRDADWMGKIYRFCGLTVSYIEQAMKPADRRAAYLADVTYCTNKEVSADFLRDRLTLGTVKGLGSALLEKITNSGRQITDRVVQRGLYCAIIDEADSVLVDEAVTPLIISGQAPNPEQVKAFVQAAEIAGKLERSADYNIDFRYREIELTDRGRQCIAELTKDLGGLWSGARRREEMIIEALTAGELYLRDKQYVVEDDKVVIVDEFTGRLMPDRHWRDGMHQAVEAKESVTINPPKDTYARISFQRFFRMYRKLAGMTGTAAEARNEFWQIYHLPVVVIPTNRPCIRKYLPEIVLTTEQAKWSRIVQEISAVHNTEKPVLVGTRSVRASEHLSGLLSEQNLEHQVLNAIYHRQEAQIVAQAGQPGRITVATNMAGRGTDIKLGRSVAELGGLHVIATERHESARVDRQLFGRCARQGDPGTAQAIVSLEDELIYRYAANLAGLLKKRITAESHQDVSSKLTAGLFRLAQNRAERIALRQRKSVLQTDHWLDEQLGFAGAE